MRRMFIGFAAIVVLAAGATTVPAATKWDQTHPRQHRILKGVRHQTAQTNQALLTGRQGHRLYREVHAIKTEERDDAKIGGGSITQGQERHMAQQLRGVSKQRRHDEKVDSQAK